jgi:two-component system alkaline phosphatase synthesis response regulator PhoP
VANPGDYHVLVVDDEQDILTFLRAALEDAGFNVDTANNGREALEAVKKKKPDFISLDLVMPGGTGIAFLHELRRNRKWINIPVMVVTGHARDELGRADLEKALEGKLLSGPRVYLEKPVTPTTYVTAVCEILGIKVKKPDQPSAADGSLQGEVTERLKGASPEQLEEVLRILKKK